MTEPREDAIGLDTSVVVRLLMGEPADLAERAFTFVMEQRDLGRRIVVSDLVVAETYFALHWHYGVPKGEAVEQMLRLLESGEMEPAAQGCALDALRETASGAHKPGFVDRLIYRQYRQDMAQVASFETVFRRLDGARIL